jgi:hypothetical protein
MELTISGLKCDTRGCDFRDDEVTFEQYPKSIGRPCPKCGASLLTQEDYDKCYDAYQKVEAFNIIKAKIQKFIPWKWLWKGKPAKLTVKLNNDGTKDVKIKKL